MVLVSGVLGRLVAEAVVRVVVEVVGVVVGVSVTTDPTGASGWDGVLVVTVSLTPPVAPGGHTQ